MTKAKIKQYKYLSKIFSGNRNPMYKNAKKITICKECGKKYKYYPSKENGLYCSKNCSHLSKEWRKKQSISKIGKIMSKEVRKKMSISHKGKKQNKQWINNRFKSFKKTWDKKGRKTPQYLLIKNSDKYKNWRKVVFERDNYTCQNCGDNKGGNLEAHHIISFVVMYEESKILNDDKGLWDIDNGITLCKDCHKKTDNYLKSINTNVNFRLIKIITKFWRDNTGQKEDFNTYYKKVIESIINQFKNKLI